MAKNKEEVKKEFRPPFVLVSSNTFRLVKDDSLAEYYKDPNPYLYLGISDISLNALRIQGLTLERLNKNALKEDVWVTVDGSIDTLSSFIIELFGK